MLGAKVGTARRTGRLGLIEVDDGVHGGQLRVAGVTPQVLAQHCLGARQVLARDREPDVGASTVRVAAGRLGEARLHAGGHQQRPQRFEGAW